MIVGAQGDHRSAGERFGEAVALFRELGDRQCLQNTYNSLGVLLINHGELVEARAVLEESRVALLAIRRFAYVAEQNLATIALLEGDADIADRMFTECLRAVQRDGYRAGTAYAFLGCALTATMRGDFHRAAVLHGVADEVIEQAGRPFEDLEAGCATPISRRCTVCSGTPPGNRATSTAGSFRRRRLRPWFSLHPRTRTAHSRHRPTRDSRATALRGRPLSCASPILRA